MSGDLIGIWGDSGTLGSGYSYGRGSPLVEEDPFGLQSGHHYVPREVLKNASVAISDEAKSVFDKVLTGSLPGGVPSHKWGPEHIAYNQAVSEFVAATGGVRTAEDAMGVMHSIWRSKDTRIQNFLNRIDKELLAGGVASPRVQALLTTYDSALLGEAEGLALAEQRQILDVAERQARSMRGQRWIGVNWGKFLMRGLLLFPVVLVLSDTARAATGPCPGTQLPKVAEEVAVGAGLGAALKRFPKLAGPLVGVQIILLEFELMKENATSRYPGPAPDGPNWKTGGGMGF